MQRETTLRTPRSVKQEGEEVLQVSAHRFLHRLWRGPWWSWLSPCRPWCTTWWQIPTIQPAEGSMPKQVDVIRSKMHPAEGPCRSSCLLLIDKKSYLSSLCGVYFAYDCNQRIIITSIHELFICIFSPCSSEGE